VWPRVHCLSDFCGTEIVTFKFCTRDIIYWNTYTCPQLIIFMDKQHNQNIIYRVHQKLLLHYLLPVYYQKFIMKCYETKWTRSIEKSRQNEQATERKVDKMNKQQRKVTLTSVNNESWHTSSQQIFAWVSLDERLKTETYLWRIILADVWWRHWYFNHQT